MGEDLQTIVVRVVSNFSGPQRRRAGFTFNQMPVSIQVNQEQLELIKNDQYLNIITKGTAYQQGLDNKQVITTEDNQNTDENLDLEEGENNSTDEVIEGDEIIMTKNQIIEALIAKGLTEGEDFNRNAKKDKLEALLNG